VKKLKTETNVSRNLGRTSENGLLASTKYASQPVRRDGSDFKNYVQKASAASVLKNTEVKFH
jgi:hypothetical protein